MGQFKPNLGNPKRFNRRIMELAGVQRKLDQVTREREGRSRAILARHRKTGSHRVYAFRDRHTRVIVLEGEASMSVQFGHHALSGRWVPGIYVLPTTSSNRATE